MNYQDINARTIDRWVDEGWEWGRPIDHETFLKARRGDWSVVLTPVKPVPREWFGDLEGKRLLGLACGGGQQMPVFCAAGAVCTVLDYSLRQLESERMVAAREGYDIEIVRADMTKPLPFEDGAFDLIFHPVSNCYIEEVEPVWRECFRVLKPGGRLLAGLDNGMNFLVNEKDESKIVNRLPFNPLKDEKLRLTLEENDDGVQFSHTLEEQLGGQLRAGFRLADLYEDTNGSGFLHEMNVPCFWATLAIRP
ncbi:MAG: class I SAM-dependent methyltransferase [Clostridia bacterium]|nr:class I SAM-dependent methyltransferase [Clostridia bacterium]